MRRILRACMAAAVLVVAVAFALWWSGLIPAFGRNRGLLQVTVAVPLTCAAAGFVAARWTGLGARVLALAIVPFLALVVAAGLVLGVEAWALPAVAALGSTAVVPWLAGVWLGTRLNGSRVRQR